MMNYGFYGEKLTHAKIGNILNLSPSYISRIKKTALEKISEYLKENESCTAKTKKRRCNKC
jgi:DNA-directed RNA polymerase specialized sigma subunit